MLYAERVLSGRSVVGTDICEPPKEPRRPLSKRRLRTIAVRTPSELVGTVVILNLNGELLPTPVTIIVCHRIISFRGMG